MDTSGPSSNITILIADPLRLFSDCLGIALSQFDGLKVFEEHPSNGPSTVETLVRLKPDIALVDFWMPDMDGPAIVSTAKTQCPATKVILMFWMSVPHQIHEALEAGPAAFVSKDGRLPELAQIVSRVHRMDAPFFDPRLDYLIKAGPQVSRDWTDFQSLTPRQLEILTLLGHGLSTQQVASRLSIQAQTVRNHVSDMLGKVGAGSSTEAVARARSCGFLRA